MPEMFLSPSSRVLSRGQSVFVPVSGRGRILEFASRQYLIAFNSGFSAWVNPLHEEIIPC